MASFEHRVEPQHDLTVMVGRGLLGPEEVKAELEQFYAQRRTRRMLWDLSDVSMAEIGRDDLKAVLTTALGHSQMRPYGKTAIVATRDLEFGMCRMYCILAELYEHPVAHAVFRNGDEALEWLMSEEAPPGGR